MQSTVKNTMMLFYVFIIYIFVCGASASCAYSEENPLLYIAISKDKVISHQLLIPSKEDTVEIYVYKFFPVKSHDDVTLDQLICYDSKSNHTMFSNQNFTFETQYFTTYNTQYIYKTTQELKKLRGSNGACLWLCKLYAHWEGYYEIYEFEANLEKNKTNECTSHDTRKQETKPAALKTFSSRNRTEQTAEPKPRGQECKCQKPGEGNDGMDGVKTTNTLKYVNDSPETIWVIFVVASVFIFILGLVIGAICRCPSAPAPAEPTDDQTYVQIYEEVVDKGVKNRPPIPVPEKAVHIYNIPYDHTPWFQKNAKEGTNANRQKMYLLNEDVKYVVKK